MNRRNFLYGSTLCLAGSAFASQRLFAAEDEPVLRVGLVADVHYAEKPIAGTRYYWEAPSKLSAAAVEFEKTPPDFLVELGDLIDSVDPATDRANLRRIDVDLSKLSKERHYVLGNHCVERLPKKDFLDILGKKDSYYSFDRGGWHFVVLDACFRQDGVPYGAGKFKWTDTLLPGEEIDWLEKDLRKTDFPCVVFLHQRLDLENGQAYAVKNSDIVRNLLEKSGKVRLVLQGHYHKGDFKEIAGIPYCTLHAQIEGSGPENNAFSFLEIFPDGDMRIRGFLKQINRGLKSPEV